MHKIGIHFRVLLAAFILLGTTTFTLGFMGLRTTHKLVRARFQERMQTLARYFAVNVELGILIDEKNILKRHAENLLQENDVVKVLIFDEKGTELMRLAKNESEVYPSVEAEVWLKGDKAVTQPTIFNGDGIPRERIIGKVALFYSTDEIDRLLNVMKKRFFWFSIGLTAVGIGIFFFISRSLVAPVADLAQSARHIASGDLTLRAALGSLPETRELAIAFNAMLDSLETSKQALIDANNEVMKQKNMAEMGKFSLMVAHEVKNPLGIIKSSLHLLKEDWHIPDDNIMVEYIEDEIKRLNRLIEDFLLFARPAKPVLRPVDLNELIQDLVERFEVLYTESKVSFELDLPERHCKTMADKDLLVRAINNVIRNACDSNQGKGQVMVSVSYDNDICGVRIADQGGGIAPENLARIFEPFYTTRAKGTGLGLAFVAQVIKAHRGLVTVKNNQEGAVFQIELPVQG